MAITYPYNPAPLPQGEEIDEHGRPTFVGPRRSMLGNPPALMGSTDQKLGRPTQAQPPMVNPRHRLWGGLLMDIGNFIGSKGMQPMQGLGPRMMMQAEQQNYERQQYAQASAEDRRRWEAEMAADAMTGVGRGPKIGNYNPGDYTPDSWATTWGNYQRTGYFDPSTLKRYGTSLDRQLESYLAANPGKTAIDFHQEKAAASAAGKEEGQQSVSGTITEQAIDTAYAPQYLEWTTGGAADALKGINQLEAALETLKTQNVSGPGIKATPDAVLRVANPLALETRSQVEEIVQRNLRLILGAQFAEKEGERLIARAYDEGVDEELNYMRVSRLLEQMRIAYMSKQQKSDFYGQNRTLRGFEDTTPTLDEFNAAIDAAEEEWRQSQGGSIDGKPLSEMSDEELRRIAEGG